MPLLLAGVRIPGSDAGPSESASGSIGVLDGSIGVADGVSDSRATPRPIYFFV